MEPSEIETETVPSILLPCTSCSRTFRPEALAKHSKVCEKILMKKRKQFDSSKQRLQGTEIESFVLQTVPKTSRKKEAQLNLSKSKWKEKVEQVRSMQAVKKPTETPLSSQVVKPSDHEECPYCGRSFGPKAYERHTEFCKEQLHKLKVSNNGNSEARERLKVRTTYRGPLTNKVLNRDRYQPNRNRDPSPLGLSTSEIYVTDDTPKSRGLSRNSSLRSSLRSKPETTPPPPLRRTMTQINPSTKGPRSSPKDINETDLLQKSQTLNNKPRMISKEPIEKRMKPTNSKTITQSSLKTAGSHPKSPPKLNNTDVNIFKELNVISCFMPGSSKSDINLKLINNHDSSVSVEGTINCQTTLNTVPQYEESLLTDLSKDCDHLKPMNDQPQSELVSSELLNINNNLEPLNYHTKNEIVTSELTNNNLKPMNIQPQNEIMTSELLKCNNNLEPIIGNPQSKIVMSELPNNNSNHFKPMNNHSKSEIITSELLIKNDTLKPLNNHSQNEIITSKLPINNNTIKPLNNHRQNEVFTSELPINNNTIKPLNNHHQNEVITSELLIKNDTLKPLNNHSQNEIITSKLPINNNTIKSLNNHHQNDTIKPQIITSELPINNNIIKPLNNHSQYEIITSERPINNNTIKPLSNHPENDTIKPQIITSELLINNDTLKPLNNHSQNEIITSKLPINNNTIKPLNNHPENDTIKPQIITSELPINNNIIKPLNNHPQNDMITSELLNNNLKPMGNQSQNKMILSERPNNNNNLKPIIVHPQTDIVISELSNNNNLKPINNHPPSEIGMSDLAKVDNHFITINDHCLADVGVQETIISDNSLNFSPPYGIASPDLPKVNRLKPVNDNHSSVVVQETMKPETPSSVDPKSEVKEVLPSKENCNQLSGNEKNNHNPRFSNSINEEINKQTDHLKNSNKNLAFTIEFEPDNRFLVYEHHKVGLKKSPLIFKKRVSKSYESVKSFINEKKNLKDIDINSNITSESEGSLKNKNLLVIDKEESAPNFSINGEVKTTDTNDLMLSNPNKVSLSWRERVLEIMDGSDNLGNKKLNTLPNKTTEQTDPCLVPVSKTFESQSDVVLRIHKPDSNDKFTDTDNSLLIDQESIDIFNANKKTLESITNRSLHSNDNIFDNTISKTVPSIPQKGETERIGDEKNSQNVEDRDEIETLQNDFLDADLYFDEENNDEVGNLQNDNSMDVDMYFVEENNVANEVLIEETSNLKDIVEDELSPKESNLFYDFNDNNIVETNVLVNPVEAHPHIQNCNDSSPRLNYGYQNKDILEEVNIDVPFVHEYEFNDLVGLEDIGDYNQSNTFIKENDILENNNSSAVDIVTSKEEEKIKCRSLSDSELQKTQIDDNKVSKILKKELDSTYEDEEDAVNFQINENVDSPTSVKDKILRLAGQEFVLMANRSKEGNTSQGFQMNHNSEIDYKEKNISTQISTDSNIYHGSYKPNTYCLNTHTNSDKDSGEIYSDIFSHLIRSNEEGPKLTSWQTLPHGSDCCADYESPSEVDSLEIKFEEDSVEDFFIFQSSSAYGDKVPFENEKFNNPSNDVSSEGARYSISSSSSSYNNRRNEKSMNKNPVIGQESLSHLPFISAKEPSYNEFKSSRIPLLKSRRNDNYKSNTLPPLFAGPKKTSPEFGQQKHKKKPDYSGNLRNDYYTNYPDIENSSEESDLDWDLSDYDTYEKKKTIFTRSSKTVYNKYYEQVEYSQESNEFQTIKTSVSNLPLPHADFFKEKELKLPKIQSKHVPIDQKVHRKKMRNSEKLPLLRKFEDCKCSSRKEKETDEDVENRNHKFLNNSIDSAYSSLTRSSGAEGDTGKAEMSRFCHECGAKYPIAGAKFCCNCGMRRITL